MRRRQASKDKLSAVARRDFRQAPGEVCGLYMTATRVTAGAASLSSSSHLPPTEKSAKSKPVMLPPSHRGAAAAPTTGASMRRPTIMRSRSTDGRSASEMPRKMTRSAPRTPSELPKVLVTVGTARRLAGRSEKGKYSCLLGIHLGNPV